MKNESGGDRWEGHSGQRKQPEQRPKTKCRVYISNYKLLGSTGANSRDQRGVGYGQRARQDPDPKGLDSGVGNVGFIQKQGFPRVFRMKR